MDSAIICETGVVTKLYQDSFVVDDGNLLICVCDKVYSIQISSLNLNWIAKADQATCFSIHRFGEGYIVHGELQLTQLSRQGDILWEFTARDILVTPDSENGFRIEHGVAVVKDWSGCEYHLNSDGNLLKEIKP